jgi:hypothetical protein
MGRAGCLIGFLNVQSSNAYRAMAAAFRQVSDGRSDEIAKRPRIERVDLPTLTTVVLDEPSVARVFALIGCRERRQRGQLPLDQSDPLNLDVKAAIQIESIRQVAFRHVQAARIVVADIERRQVATIVVLCNVVSDCCAGESVHHTKADAVLVKHRL